MDASKLFDVKAFLPLPQQLLEFQKLMFKNRAKSSLSQAGQKVLAV
jgi:hypothetical protein